MFELPARVLLIQLRRIGDTVLIAPALDALREAWPNTRIHLLTEYPSSDLFQGDDRVDVIWVRPPKTSILKLLPNLKRERFDLVLDFQSLPATSMLARSVAPDSVGFRDRFRWHHRSIDLGRHTGTHYTADHKLDLLRAVGLSPTSIIPRLCPPPAPHEIWNERQGSPKVLLSPVSPWPHKRWSSDAFAEAAQGIHAATGAAFVIAGGPGEDNVVQAVASGLASVPHRTLTLNRLPDFARLCLGADLFLGNDNGPRHIALALGLPTIGYFSEVNPIFWTPPDPRHPVLWDLAHANGRSLPSGRTILPPRPEEAIRAAVQLLEGSERIPSRGHV
jgi:ADP-heptose:LPS heptosyltransferase